MDNELIGYHIEDPEGLSLHVERNEIEPDRVELCLEDKENEASVYILLDADDAEEVGHTLIRLAKQIRGEQS